MTLELGTPVWRKGKAYSGPGIIRGYAYSEDCTTVTHYIVAYNILGGEGQLLHIHTPNELTVLQGLAMTPERIAELTEANCER